MGRLSERVSGTMEVVERVLMSSVQGSSVLEDMGTSLLESGGKRLRPQLLIISYLAGGDGDISRVTNVAVALELIHMASLIHDDITDDPTLRRRQPAPHRRYGVSRALVAGDYMFAKSFELLIGIDENVARLLADAAVAMAEGEHRELVLSFDATVSREQHEEIMDKKTASLFVASAKVGAALAGMGPERVVALEGFARNLGMAFQVVDDVLDLEPSAALTGKPSGMDLREGRMNTVLLTALDRLEDPDRDTVVRVFMASSPSNQDVENALALVRGTGAGGISLGIAQRYAEAAIGSLGDHFEGEVRELLEGIALEVVRRRS
jgi:geranylgeranyl pyrophosphate synthase